MEAKSFCTTFLFFDVCPEILARPHCKEKCSYTELSDDYALYGGAIVDEFLEDNEWENLLLFKVAVKILISTVLLR